MRRGRNIPANCRGPNNLELVYGRSVNKTSLIKQLSEDGNVLESLKAIDKFLPII